MERHDPVWTSSCARDRQPGSVGAKCGFACYLLLAVGIWVAYLWLIYSRPLATSPPSSPAVVGVFTEGPAPPSQPPRLIEVNYDSNNRQDDPAPQVTVVASAMRSYSPPASEPLPFGPTGYTARKTLILDIQRELTRARCYRGAMTGRWGVDTKRAMSAFLLAANARLPINQPDDVLLRLVQSHDHASCGERRPTEVQLVAPIESKSGPDRPPGLMGIGGPKPETSAANAHPSDEPEIGRARKQTVRKIGGEIEGNRTPRFLLGQRSVRELLSHPLGTY